MAWKRSGVQFPLAPHTMICVACKKEYEPDELHCPHCLALNELSFHDEEMIVNDYFE